MPLSPFHSIPFDSSIPHRSRRSRIPRKKTTTPRGRQQHRPKEAERREESFQRSNTAGEEPMPQPEEADDDFTFPTPPPPQLPNGHYRSSSPPPAWLFSSPIRRSFSAADCAGSPWRATRGACCSPAISDYGAGGFEEDEEELMDSLWEDLNDDEAPAGGKNDLFVASLDVSRRRSVGGPGHSVERRIRRPTATTKEREAASAVLAPSRSSRRRSPGLVVMMRVLKKMFVAHKSRSRVHKVDDQSTASASSSGNSFKK